MRGSGGLGELGYGYRPGMARRARLDRRDLRALARLGGHRRQAWWQVLGVESELPLFGEQLSIPEAVPALAPPSEGEDLLHDYNSLGLSLGRHPMALLRQRLRQRRFRTAAELREASSRRLVRTAGLVVTRQRPGSGKGVTFITMEDETGIVNVVVWPALSGRFRREVTGARLLGVVGIWERRGEVCHLMARRLEDHSHLLGGLKTTSRDFQ